MQTTGETVGFGFCEERFPAGTHMGLIYSSDEERERVITEYIQSGLTQGEKVAYFASDHSVEQIRAWLEEAGIKNLPERCDQNLIIGQADETYCPHGYFAPDEMLGTLKNFHRQACSEHFSGSRVSGEMAWALKGNPGSERLMEYESRVNQLVLEYPVNAICQYDARRFDGDQILECLKVHPYMIVRGQIVQNPYYLSTEEYLAQNV